MSNPKVGDGTPLLKGRGSRPCEIIPRLIRHFSLGSERIDMLRSLHDFSPHEPMPHGKGCELERGDVGALGERIDHHHPLKSITMPRSLASLPASF